MMLLKMMLLKMMLLKMMLLKMMLLKMMLHLLLNLAALDEFHIQHLYFAAVEKIHILFL
jgi:hypothetical protein